MARVLIVWREGPHRDAIAELLSSQGWETQCEATVDEGITAGNSEDFDVVIFDQITGYFEGPDNPLPEEGSLIKLTDCSRYVEFVKQKHSRKAREQFHRAPLLVVTRRKDKDASHEIMNFVGGWCMPVDGGVVGFVTAYWCLSDDESDRQVLILFVRRMLEDEEILRRRRRMWEVAVQGQESHDPKTGERLK